MNIYGYQENLEKLHKLKEITLSCDSDELTEIISFLQHVHNQISNHSKDFEHEHLQDWKKENAISHSGPDIVVFNSKTGHTSSK